MWSTAWLCLCRRQFHSEGVTVLAIGVHLVFPCLGHGRSHCCGERNPGLWHLQDSCLSLLIAAAQEMSDVKAVGAAICRPCHPLSMWIGTSWHLLRSWQLLAMSSPFPNSPCRRALWKVPCCYLTLLQDPFPPHANVYCYLLRHLSKLPPCAP